MASNNAVRLNQLRSVAAMSVALFIGWFAWQLFGPDPPIIVSKETTYLTAPLRADGLPDYEKYVLEKYREGVTPENNAAVLLLQAMGPGNMKPEEFAAVAKEIGLAQIPSEMQTLEYWYSKENRQQVANWLREQGRLPVQARTDETESGSWPLGIEADEVVDEILFSAMERPWTSAETPPLGEWVVRNREPLDLLIAATKRQRFYAPPPKLLDDQTDSLLVAMFNQSVQSTRDAARMLIVRAMWHVGEGRPEEAWQDLLATHRLARLIGSSNTTHVETLVAIGNDSIAFRGTLELLNDPRTSAKLARKIGKELVRLGPPSAVANSLELERIVALDLLLLVKKEHLELLEFFGFHAAAIQLANAISIDWNVLLIEENRFRDELAAAFNLPERPARRTALTKLEARRNSPSYTPGHLVVGAINRQVRTRSLGDVLSTIARQPETIEWEAEDRANTQLKSHVIAAALTAYRAENEEYPEKLEALVPICINVLPTDVYNNNSFVYRRTANGYLLYSRGPNGQDDGGNHESWEIYRGYSTSPRLHEAVQNLLGDEMPVLEEDDEDGPPGLQKSDRLLKSPLLDHIPTDADDIAIRVPLPKLELPKRAEPQQ